MLSYGRCKESNISILSFSVLNKMFSYNYDLYLLVKTYIVTISIQVIVKILLNSFIIVNWCYVDIYSDITTALPGVCALRHLSFYSNKI